MKWSTVAAAEKLEEEAEIAGDITVYKLLEELSGRYGGVFRGEIMSDGGREPAGGPGRQHSFA